FGAQFLRPDSADSGFRTDAAVHRLYRHRGDTLRPADHRAYRPGRRLRGSLPAQRRFWSGSRTVQLHGSDQRGRTGHSGQKAMETTLVLFFRHYLADRDGLVPERLPARRGLYSGPGLSLYLFRTVLSDACFLSATPPYQTW